MGGNNNNMMRYQVEPFMIHRNAAPHILLPLQCSSFYFLPSNCIMMRIKMMMRRGLMSLEKMMSMIFIRMIQVTVLKKSGFHRGGERPRPRKAGWRKWLCRRCLVWNYQNTPPPGALYMLHYSLKSSPTQFSDLHSAQLCHSVATLDSPLDSTTSPM